MSESLNSLMLALSEDAKKEKAKANDNDIIDWIKAHWYLFTVSRRDMQTAVSMLGDQFDYSARGIAMALGLPDNMYFTRCKAADIGRTMLQFSTSKLFKEFLECCDKHKSKEIVLIAVAGDSTIIATNMQTVFASGHMHLFLKSSGDLRDIHLFSWKDARVRLPNVFLKENRYE